MVEISTDSRNRTGLRQDGGTRRSTARSSSSRSRSSPGSAGTRFARSSSAHAGWVKSPVPMTVMPLRLPHQARCSRSQSRLQALEYFEWMCRSAMNGGMARSYHLRPTAGALLWCASPRGAHEGAGMASPLVETKLFPPKLRRRLVARPRLRGRLSRGAASRLTLVSAPAGFGKTTLLAEWLAATGTEGPVAWLSREEGDSQPASYWAYLITALQAAVPGVGASALPLLQSGQPPIETVLTIVLNELGTVPTGIYLVVDDYHLVDGPGVRAGMTFLLEHLPPQVHLVVSTREDPDLPLARLRARGELVEVRAADLRFTLDEVLGRQPADVRSFLVQTCILDRLSGPLCDAVTGRHGGKAMLESLDRANLFLVPLDDRRRWYRYHHLFADVLRTHLMDEHPDRVAALHHRASRWHERNREPSPAIRHALAAGDVERAAGLVELAIPELRRSRQEATIRGWLDAIPDEMVRVRPVLAVGFIGALMAGGEFEGVEDRLRDAERGLERTGDHEGTRTPPVGMVVVDEGELPRLPGAIQMYRAALALVRGDVPGTIGHAQRAIDRAAEGDDLTRAGASALMGLAFWDGGDLEAAHRAYSGAVEGLQRAGHIADVLGCSITLADIRSTQGRLSEALRTYEQALRLASDHQGTVLRGTADMYVGMSQIACERDDLPAATKHLRHAQELGEHTWLPQNPYRWRGAVARGRVGDALAWAREQGLSADDDLSYLREFEHVTLARALLAWYRAKPSDSQ